VGRDFTGRGKKKKPSFRGMFFAEESLFSLDCNRCGVSLSIRNDPNRDFSAACLATTSVKEERCGFNRWRIFHRRSPEKDCTWKQGSP
jgi:hypothetical protein